MALTNKLKTLKCGNWTISGLSVGGVGTCIMIPELKLCFDMGVGFAIPEAIKFKFVAISHGHCDHIGELHFHSRLRRMRSYGVPIYIMPQACVQNFKLMFDCVVNLDAGHEGLNIKSTDDDFILYGVAQGEMREFELNSKNFCLQTIPTSHSVPSIGYCVVNKRRKLLEDYKSLSPKEIIAKRNSGEVVDRMVDVPEISYSGDTSIDAVLENELFTRAKVLIMECTFLDDSFPQEEARKHGHIHIADLRGNEDKFLNEWIVLMHFSSRYTEEEIRRLVYEESQLSPQFLNKVLVL